MKVKLTGNPNKQVSRDAIGARIYVNLPNGNVLWREVRSTDGYMSVHPKQQHFGLGGFKQVSIDVVWPNGEKTQHLDVEANQALILELD